MNKRLKAYKKGLWAEWRAALYLRFRGYRILKMRYKTPVGEIDLIALKKETLVIAEVKARANLDEALHAVHPRTQIRIEKAARYFLASYPQYGACALRFDLMAFGAGLWPTHLDNAWQARS